MPVARMLDSVDCSVKGGAEAWIGREPFAPMGPASSTGSPMTFMMRPSVSSPTGMRIGLPVSVTDWPRTRPSVASMAMVRTVFSPRCWATSRTSRLPLLEVSSAFRIGGNSPSNATSTTAPMTCEMRPAPAVLALEDAAAALAAAGFFLAVALGAALGVTAFAMNSTLLPCLSPASARCRSGHMSGCAAGCSGS